MSQPAVMDRAGVIDNSTTQPDALLLVIAAGCALLAARPLFGRWASDPTAQLVVLFVALLLVGAMWPVAAPRVALARRRVLVPLAVGIVAFALGRVLGGGHAPAAIASRVLALNTLAAVAEEAFFRRLVYARLLVGGEIAAIVGSAVLFAAVHVSVYGLWVLPIDLAAGLLLGWQRHASGSWVAPAATHVFANILVVI
ncbi:MAG TPA: CPBP family intramembrane glutamic endopeptidase [Acidimicrobiia bacterium]